MNKQILVHMAAFKHFDSHIRMDLWEALTHTCEGWQNLIDYCIARDKGEVSPEYEIDSSDEEAFIRLKDVLKILDCCYDGSEKLTDTFKHLNENDLQKIELYFTYSKMNSRDRLSNVIAFFDGKEYDNYGDYPLVSALLNAWEYLYNKAQSLKE